MIWPGSSAARKLSLLLLTMIKLARLADVQSLNFNHYSDVKYTEHYVLLVCSYSECTCTFRAKDVLTYCTLDNKFIRQVFLCLILSPFFLVFSVLDNSLVLVIIIFTHTVVNFLNTPVFSFNFTHKGSGKFKSDAYKKIYIYSFRSEWQALYLFI